MIAPDRVSRAILAALDGLDLRTKLAVLSGSILCVVANTQMRPEVATDLIAKLAASLPSSYAHVCSILDAPRSTETH